MRAFSPALCAGLVLLFATPVQAASPCDDPEPEWLMCEDFEQGGLGWQAWFEQSSFIDCNGCPEGMNDPDRIALLEDAAIAHDGDWSLSLPATAAGGYKGGALAYRSCSGSGEQGCSLDGYEDLYFRSWVRLAEDHEYVHHFLSIAGTQPDEYWNADGNAGCRPNGQRAAGTTLDFNAEHKLFFYTYFPEMSCDMGGYCDGTYAQDICNGCAQKGMACENGLECCWGNTFKPESDTVLETGDWVCLELHMHINTPGQDDGTMAFWVDDELALEQGGMHWRDVEDLELNKAWLQHYIATGDADQPNQVWFDDVVVSTERIGCGAGGGGEESGDGDSDGGDGDGDGDPSDGDPGDSNGDPGDSDGTPGDDGSDGDPGDGGNGTGSSETGPAADEGEGCSCSSSGPSSPWPLGSGSLLLALLWVRRGRRDRAALSS